MKTTRLLAIASVAYVVLLFLPRERFCSAGTCHSSVGWQHLFWGGIAALGVIFALDLARRSTDIWLLFAGYLGISTGIITGADFEGIVVQDSGELDLLTWTAFAILGLAGVMTILGLTILAGGWRETRGSVTKLLQRVRKWRFGSAETP